MTRNQKLATLVGVMFGTPQVGGLLAGLTVGFDVVVLEMMAIYFSMGLLVSLGIVVGCAFKDDSSTGDSNG